MCPSRRSRKSWLRDSARSLLPSGEGGAFLSYLFAIFLAALIAFVIAVELPKILSFVSKQHSAAYSFGERFEGEAPRPLSGLWNAASGAKAAGAARSDSALSSTTRRAAAINSAAPAPVARVSPPRPAEPTNAASVPQHPLPARSPPANSAPAVAAPPATGVAPPAERRTATIDPATPAPVVRVTPVKPTERIVAAFAPEHPAPAVVAPPVANVAPSAAPVRVESGNTAPFQPEKPVRPLGTDAIETLLKQGKGFVAVGDFASARVVFERVAEAHDARGAMALAATYDPVVLAKIGAAGATPDVAKAREWYMKARALGSPDAAPRLEVLANSKR